MAAERNRLSYKRNKEDAWRRVGWFAQARDSEKQVFVNTTTFIFNSFASDKLFYFRFTYESFFSHGLETATVKLQPVRIFVDCHSNDFRENVFLHCYISAPQMKIF